MDWGLILELFPYAIASALVAGVVCPVVGCFLLVRRTGFYGVALPQFASAGVLAGYATLPWWIANVGLGGMDLPTALQSPHALEAYLLVWAILCTLSGLFALAVSRDTGGTEPARVAASFAIASAAAILFAMAAPTGAERVESMLKGEILVVGLHEFETIAVAYGLILAVLGVYHRDLLLVSFDRETARVLGEPARRYELVLAAVTGVAVSVGVVVIGPVVLFGLLVIPPLAARGLARSMRSFYLWSAALGLVSSVGGVVTSFSLDWPLGPSVVVVATLLLGASRTATAIRTPR